MYKRITSTQKKSYKTEKRKLFITKFLYQLTAIKPVVPDIQKASVDTIEYTASL